MSLFNKGQVICGWTHAHPTHPDPMPQQPFRELYPWYAKLFCPLSLQQNSTKDNITTIFSTQH